MFAPRTGICDLSTELEDREPLFADQAVIFVGDFLFKKALFCSQAAARGDGSKRSEEQASAWRSCGLPTCCASRNQLAKKFTTNLSVDSHQTKQGCSGKEQPCSCVIRCGEPTLRRCRCRLSAVCPARRPELARRMRISSCRWPIPKSATTGWSSSGRVRPAEPAR